MIKKNFLKFFGLFFLIFTLTMFLLCFLYIKISFKTEYKSLIEENLNAITLNSLNLNTNLVLSIIKQESKFNKSAKSNKDAFGLMQLTYPTALEVAKKLNLEISIEDLYKPNINIKLGINYLNYLFSIFEDKQLVILSYNAGFNKVKSWQNDNKLKKENGVYITPYKETNTYIKKVIFNEKVYNLL